MGRLHMIEVSWEERGSYNKKTEIDVVSSKEKANQDGWLFYHSHKI